MLKPTSIHHLAFNTANMKGQIEFFTEVMGMELIALYWMHGAEGCWHGFMKLNDTCSIAFVFTPATPNIKAIEGVTHATDIQGSSAPGTGQHIAFNVETMEDMLNLRDRIRSKGVNISGPIEQEMSDSMYFAGPEGLLLEVALSKEPINAKAWIDPEVVALAGISQEELARYTSPAPYTGKKGVWQPKKDESKPHFEYAPPLGDKVLKIPDWLMKIIGSYTKPPVKVDKKDLRKMTSNKVKSTSFHHLVFSTANMKEQIEFYTDVLGMELIALHRMQGAEDSWQAYMSLNDTLSMAFVFTPDTPNIKSIPGVTHATSAAGGAAPGTVQHIGFNVNSYEEILGMRDRIRSTGVNVIGPIDHGMCWSMYFAGPEGLLLEVAWSADPIHPQVWIDPEVVALAGINDEELARYISPEPFVGQGGAVPQSV